MFYKNLTRRYAPIFLLLAVAGLFTLPQIVSRGMIVGSDAIFHFNRFYDSGMQIKTGNFNYFISTFGFQQTGRIVNSFYGPLMSYIQGMLLIICGTWFRYQICSNFLLYAISGISMFHLLRSNLLSNNISLFIALIFMTTYSVHYWTIGQCFSSWGTAFLPIALIPLRKMVLYGKIERIQLAASVALLMQIHLFSCLMLIAIYFIFFLYSFVKNSCKGQMIRGVIEAIILCSLLTANIWLNLYHLYQTNQIVSPFVNRTLHLATVNRSSWYWLVNPIGLFPITLWQIRCFIRNHRQFSQINKIFTLTALVFLVLSSSLVPWKYLMEKELPFVQMIQFPFRFFLPFTVLLLSSFGLSLEERQFEKNLVKHQKVMVFFSVLQVLLLSGYGLSQWFREDIHHFESLHTKIQPVPSNAIKQSFFSENIELALRYWQKSTPDYLPLYKQTQQNRYGLYEELILNEQQSFTKEANKDGVKIEWIADKQEMINLPIVLYKNSRINVNGQDISNKAAQLSAIGTPKIQQIVGINYATLSYQPPSYFVISLLLTGFSWLFLFVSKIFNIYEVKLKNITVNDGLVTNQKSE